MPPEKAIVTDLAFFSGATTVSNCDSATEWSGAPTLDSVEFIQGAGALSAKVSKTTYTSVFTFASAVNLTGKQLYVWAMTIAGGGLDTIANGGFRIRIEDATGAYAEWYVAGKDTWGGGWAAWMVHVDTAATVDTGVNKAAVTKAGIVFVTTRSAAVINCWWDALRYGTFIGLKGGTSTDPVDFDFLLAQEALVANRWGTAWRLEGIIFIQAKLRIGSTTAGESTYFKDVSEIVMFPDRAVPADFYAITFQGNATGTTEIYFGEEVGGKGVSGLFIRSASPDKRFTLTATDTTVTKFGLRGTTFFYARRITFPPYSADKKVLSCNFESCWEVFPSTTMMKYCNFIAPSGETPARACRISYGGSLNITNCNFINCSRATNVTVDGTVTITFDALVFSGNTYDVDKSSPTGDLTIENTNLSNASTYIISGGGTVTIVSAITLTVRKVKSGNEPTEYVRCSIHKKSDMSEIMNKDADIADDQNPGYYKATMSYTQAGFIVIVRAREKAWLPFEIELTIPSGGLDVTAVWLPDPNYQA